MANCIFRTGLHRVRWVLYVPGFPHPWFLRGLRGFLSLLWELGFVRGKGTTLGSQDQGLQQEYTSSVPSLWARRGRMRPLMISDHSWSQSIQISFQYGWSKSVPVVYFPGASIALCFCFCLSSELLKIVTPEGRHLQTVTQRLGDTGCGQERSCCFCLAAGGTGGLFFWVSPGMWSASSSWLHTPGRVWEARSQMGGSDIIRKQSSSASPVSSGRSQDLHLPSRSVGAAKWATLLQTGRHAYVSNNSDAFTQSGVSLLLGQ